MPTNDLVDAVGGCLVIFKYPLNGMGDQVMGLLFGQKTDLLV